MNEVEKQKSTSLIEAYRMENHLEGLESNEMSSLQNKIKFKQRIRRMEQCKKEQFC